jgi:CCR4-NOT transcription complex subunit 7/8
MKGSLNKIATSMDIKRVGTTHQAGSDSLVTSKLFFKILEQLGDQIDLEREKNNVHGLTDEFVDSAKPPKTNSYVNNNNNNNGNGFNPKMMGMPGFNPNFHPMTIHSTLIYQQNVNNFYRPNINVNNGFYNNFFPPQFDMMRFNGNYNCLNSDDMNYISNNNIVTN